MSQLQALLADGFAGNLPNPQTLQAIARLSQAEAAAYCRVSLETYRRWLRDRPTPPMALRLMSLRAGFMPWPGWERYLYCPSDGLLYHESLKYGFQPHDLLRLHWQTQEVHWLRRALAQVNRTGSVTLGTPFATATGVPLSQTEPNPGFTFSAQGVADGRSKAGVFPESVEVPVPVTRGLCPLGGTFR